MLRFIAWLSLATIVLSWRSAFAAARHIADSFPGFEGFELWRPWMRGGDYFVVTRWADEASHDAYAAARRERDPNTVVSHADGTMSFEKVEFSE